MAMTFNKRERWIIVVAGIAVIGLVCKEHLRIAHLERQLMAAESAMGIGLSSMSLAKAIIFKQKEIEKAGTELGLGIEDVLLCYKFEPITSELRGAVSGAKIILERTKVEPEQFNKIDTREPIIEDN